MIAAIHLPLLAGVAVGAAVIASAALARVTRIPAPVYLVLAGLAVGVLPGVREIRLPPDVVFFGFLPPLLYAAAFVTAPREARANWRSILVLAFGLTAATLFAVGGVAWAFIGSLGAGAAFVLGAVLSPTDPVSATGVISTSSAPQRLRTILEGESLVNDGVGLVAFSVAVTAATHGGFSVGDGLLKFVQLSAGGIGFGILLGVVIETVRRRVHDVQIEVAVSLLTPYLAYIPAERLHLSGVLATVAVGVFLGWRSEGIFRPEVRVQSLTFWELLTFILSSVLFVLLGTQFRPVVQGLGGYSAGTLARDALLVFVAVTLVRFAWMLLFPHGSWRERTVLGWAGMRGALSLAAALSIPAAVAHREVILFLTFTTIVGGLVLLGIPFPWLLDRLGYRAADTGPTEAFARVAAVAAQRLTERGLPEDAESYVRARRAVIDAQRAELHRMEHAEGLSHSIAREIERRLDHEEAALLGLAGADEHDAGERDDDARELRPRDPLRQDDAGEGDDHDRIERREHADDAQ
jgi:Na+/H+ antiporter